MLSRTFVIQRARLYKENLTRGIGILKAAGQIHPVSRCSTILNFRDTIYAVSSGRGKCGVAVVRVSGPQTKCIMTEMAGLSVPPKPRHALLKTIIDPQSRESLDKGLLLWFPGPDSFTGEDSCEFQVHGGIAVISAILQTLNKFTNTRHAEAGEFTKRSFINGKLDLTKVEGLGDVIHAETEIQRKQAFRQMSGELADLYQTWRRQIIKSMASVEAYIDFSEEENIEDDVMDRVRESLVTLNDRITKHLSDGRKGERLRDGVHIAILGRPNVGKSSLVNYLSRRPVAIVSPIEGTTRDIVESTLDINGYPVIIVDTAGLRSSSDEIEQEGVRRAVSRSHQADLLIIMLSVDELNGEGDIGVQIHQSVTQLIDERLKIGEDLDEKSVVIVVNKTDLLSEVQVMEHGISPNHWQSLSPNTRQEIQQLRTIDNSSDVTLSDVEMSEGITTNNTISGGTISNNTISRGTTTNNTISINSRVTPVIFTSLTQTTGLEHLMSELTHSVKQLCADPKSETLSYTQSRHRNHLTNCVQSLGRSLDLLDVDVVMTAEKLRLAAAEMGQITGIISSEEVLDVLFKDFCIGK